MSSDRAPVLVEDQSHIEDDEDLPSRWEWQESAETGEHTGFKHVDNNTSLQTPAGSTVILDHIIDETTQAPFAAN